MVGVSGGTSTPIEDLEKVAERVYELAGTAAGRATRPTWRGQRVTAVAEPAYRSCSLDEHGHPRRPAAAAGAA